MLYHFTFLALYLVGPDALPVGQLLALAAGRPHEQQGAAHLVHAVANLQVTWGQIINPKLD